MSNHLSVCYAAKPCKEELAMALESFPLPSGHDSVAIKPNLVVAKPSESGATTDPDLVACVIETLRDRGCRDIQIIESSWVGESTGRAFKRCGYSELGKRYGVPLVDLKKSSTIKVTIDGFTLEVCREALESTFLINMPVLKAHCQTRLTCALKNLKGCIPDREKRRFHTLGLHEPITKLAAAVKTNLTIVDGIIGDLTFEEGGTPVFMGRIIVGDDPVLVDSYASELLGYSVEEIPYIGLAEGLGVGTNDLTHAEVTEFGEPLADLTEARPHYRSRLSGFVVEDQACSACYGSLMHALKRFEDRGGHLAAGTQLLIGQGFSEKASGERPGPYLGIGRCTRGLGNHVPGCPPTASAILKALEKMGTSFR